MSTSSSKAGSITGIQAMRGEGVRVSQGFWADAWDRVIKRHGAVMGLTWIGIVVFFAIFAPLLANGHPMIQWELDDAGQRGAMSSPMLEHLKTADWLILIWAVICGVGFVLPIGLKRSTRLGWIIAIALQSVGTVVVAAGVRSFAAERDAAQWVRDLEQSPGFEWWASAACALVMAMLFLIAPTCRAIWRRAVFVSIVGAVATVTIALTWQPSPPTYPYSQRELAGEIDTVYTLIPWSPAQRTTDRSTLRLRPGEGTGSALADLLTVDLPLTGEIGEAGIDRVERGIARLPLTQDERDLVAQRFGTWAAQTSAITSEMARDELRQVLRPLGRPFHLGTDTLGQDVASQMMHATRLSVSIGLVSTGIAVLIGVTLGSLMGYFGGTIDLALYRVVEVFMAIPVLFTLIVVAGVLPRNTYVMMAIIGCFTWHYSARFTRAEFLRLRNQDFVQSARAAGLPLRSILFKHMLPNGVTPVLVDSSFSIALAIQYEATLSFLGLGPVDQPSWGRLLSDAAGDAGAFAWWLAIFPGFGIFLTVLAYNLLGEALRDAIDPKLRKARV